MDIFAHHIGVVEPGPQKHNRSSPNSHPCTQNGFPLFRQSLDAVVPCKSATSGCTTIKGHLTTDRSSDSILSCVPFRNMCYYKIIPTVGIFIIQFSRPRAPKHRHGYCLSIYGPRSNRTVKSPKFTITRFQRSIGLLCRAHHPLCFLRQLELNARYVPRSKLPLTGKEKDLFLCLKGPSLSISLLFFSFLNGLFSYVLFWLPL